MLIDWFTVGAQIINFVILVWLLKRFLYKPIIKAIDAREAHIAAELADAEAKKSEAKKERDDFQAKSKAFDDQRGAMLAKTVADAKAEHDRLMDEVRKDVEALRQRQHAALQSDGRRLDGELARLATKEVFGIARKALSDLATVSLEERMGEVFTRRLREMDGKAKEGMATALRTSREPALVLCTFDLPATQKAAIQNALNETFSSEVRIRFETVPDAICGIELTANGQKLAWSVADYVSTLEKKVGALIEAQSVPAVDTAPAPASATPPPTAPLALAAAK
jgi:F-type H+-transporting ATPase subunit b